MIRIGFAWSAPPDHGVRFQLLLVAIAVGRSMTIGSQIDHTLLGELSARSLNCLKALNG